MTTMTTPSARVPILTYHGRNVFGSAYANNDHVALASDLQTITARGWRIAPLTDVVDAFLAGRVPRDTLCLTFDDGTDYDVRALDDPDHGLQPGLLNLLAAFQARHPGAQPGLRGTAFVIASPDARHAMDVECVHGRGWMGETWWKDAVDGGLMDIGNHSWDHNHEAVPVVAQRNQQKGNFHCIDSEADAEAQIRQAHAYIAARAPCAANDLFCYPYGHVAPYLRDTYLPAQAASAKPFVRAAFGTDAGCLTPTSDRWNLPRYVCGWHWKSPGELGALLDAARAG